MDMTKDVSIQLIIRKLNASNEVTSMLLLILL
nr:MAG TPA: hypothetical protein [Caudoviricetes sp.]